MTSKATVCYLIPYKTRTIANKNEASMHKRYYGIKQLQHLLTLVTAPDSFCPAESLFMICRVPSSIDPPEGDKRCKNLSCTSRTMVDDVLNPTRVSSPQRVESEAIVPELVDSCLKEVSKSTTPPIIETTTPSSLMLNDDKMELFDRSTEIAQLKQAYQHLSLSQSIGHRKNFVLVSGEAGSGKTSVATTLKESVDQGGGYFVSGSFDSMNMEPYHAFAAAFTDFANQVVARDEVTDMRNSIQETVKSEAVMLMNVIPALREILGNHQPPPHSSMLPSQDALMRFANTFQSLLSAIATPGRSLVIFLDNLHHADDCSLGLLTKSWYRKLIQGIMCCLFARARASWTNPIQSVRRFERLRMRTSKLRILQYRIWELIPSAICSPSF